LALYSLRPGLLENAWCWRHLPDPGRFSIKSAVMSHWNNCDQQVVNTLIR